MGRNAKARGISRILALVLALVLALPALAAGESLPQALAAGDSLHGFVVKSAETFELVGAPAYLLEHEKTGAQVYFIQSRDTNRAFDITFRTPALDNTGAPHVFEHITISGSEKYPAPNVFFPIVNQTYNTFINAFTDATFTTYPLSSLSEEQLLKLADVYLDGVFHPLLYSDERLYRREAWRYEMADLDAPLTITGTVYNEMKGARTIGRLSMQNLKSLLFPGSVAGNDSGGDPAYIPDLTYRQLLDFHAAYYHPSNTLVVLYGDLDLARFLRLLDEDYFSHYDRKDIRVETGAVPPQEAPVEASFPFAVEAASPVENGTYLGYGFVANGATREEEMTLNLLTDILSHDASPLMVAMREALPGVTVSAYIDNMAPETYVVFEAAGANEADAAVFKATVDGALAQISRDGLDPALADAVLAAMKLQTLTITEMPNLGAQIAPSIGSMWSRYGDVSYFNDYLAALGRLQAEADTRIFTDAIDAYLLGNPHAALAVTYPQPGLAEAQAQELADALAEYKASLGEEELEALVRGTAEMAAFSAEEPPAEIVQALVAVTVDTLPEEAETYAVADETIGGVRYVTATAQVGDIGQTQALLDTSWVPFEDLHYLALYASLVGRLDTARFSKEELALLDTRYLGGLAVSADMQEMPGETYLPFLSAYWLGLTDAYDVSVDLAREILFETKFDNMADIQNQVSMLKTSARQMAEMTPYVFQIIRGKAAFTAQGAYTSYLNGLEFFQFLGRVEREIQEEPEKLTAKLAEIQAGLRNKAGAVALFAGNQEGLALFAREMPAFFEGMGEESREPADYGALPAPARREGLAVDSPVQYNMIFAPLDQVGLENSGVLAPAVNVIYDAYLTPLLRFGQGAYDTIASMSRDGVLFLSFRDPAVAETYAVYEGLPGFVRDLELSQEDLDRYIIKAYADLAMPTGALVGAGEALALHLAGRDPAERLARMREMKGFTVEAFRALAPAFDRLLETGARSTAGSAAAVEANGALFDAVLRLE